MFSREKAIHTPSSERPDILEVIDTRFNALVEDNNLCGGFVCQWQQEIDDIEILIVNGIPHEPFFGARKESVSAFAKECLDQYPAPHVHGLSKSNLWSDVSSLHDTSKWNHRAIFIPGYAYDVELILICFAESDLDKNISPELLASVAEFIKLSAFLLSSDSIRDRLNTMEIYVREVGHDLASSVQAIISKLRNVSTGLLTGKLALTKVREAELEIMSAYRTAETLGITVDPNYNIGCGEEFDLCSVTDEIIRLCISEANERHIEIIKNFRSSRVELWGDPKAIQSAIMQYLINAIKYAAGSSKITILIAEVSSNEVEVSVTDFGKPLDDDEKLHMWKFGWRGVKAKELHVNGSGIGLHTVKKIIQAHGGSVGYKERGNSGRVVTFFFRIPKRDILKKSLLQK